MGSLEEARKTQDSPGQVVGEVGFAQGHKDPVSVSLSGYVSVSPSHTRFIPDLWNIIFTFSGEVVVEVQR